ncbi:MAG: ComF family protein [Paracoccaceae bacterium]
MKEWRRIQTVLSAIYPPRCLSCGEMVEDNFGLCGSCWGETSFIGGTVCDQCGTPLPGEAAPDEHVACDACQRSEHPWDKGRAAFIYGGTGRKLVLSLKHGDRQDIAHPAAHWLAMAGKDLLLDKSTLIAPVPLHWIRLLKRRYNQSALLAQALSRQSGVDWCPDLLIRHRRTPSLDGKSQEQRRETVQDAFAIHQKRKHRIVGRGVLLIDDVMTTGATLAVTAQTCLDAGADHVNVLCLARVVKDA